MGRDTEERMKNTDRIFVRRALNQRLREWDLGTPDGLEKAWVHQLMLAWQRHYLTHRHKEI